MKNKKSDYLDDVLDTADMGELWLRCLARDMEGMSREIDNIDIRVEQRHTIQDRRNHLLGEALILSVLLLRHARSNEPEVLDIAEQKLRNLIKQAGEFGTQVSMPNSFWQDLVEACGTMADTRFLKNKAKQGEPK